MRKYHILISVLTLIIGFTFYGETIIFPIHDTYYVIPAEVVCFYVWLILTLILHGISLKNYFSRNEA